MISSAMHASAATPGPAPASGLAPRLAARVLYSTFLGGIGDESAARVAVDPAGNVYVTGTTFLTRITLEGPVILPTPHLVVEPTEALPGSTVTATWGGIASPSSEDLLVLYNRIAKITHESGTA